MAIFFNEEKKTFTLETLNTKYILQIVFGRFPVHLYYGKKDGEVPEYNDRYRAFSPYLAEYARKYSGKYSPDTALLEFSGFGSGDYRATSLKLRNGDGNAVCSFEYKGYNIFDGRKALPGLPHAEADEDTKTLELIVFDTATNATVHLFYTVFPNEDIISRYVTVENTTLTPIRIEKIMSLTLDIPSCEFDMISLYGEHNIERSFQRQPLFRGNQSIFSRRGSSSHQYNPFFALCSHDAEHSHGDVYGFNFVYSGNFLDEVEVDQTCGTRVQVGLGGENFAWLLDVGESFTTPEAVMTYTDKGIGAMSRNFHKFIRAKILPPEPFEKRPVVLNTWEACYFDIDENALLRFADSAAKTGMDMVVMDDGWFGTRNSEYSGLGDWVANPQKFKNGLAPFVKKMKSHGIKFGIWIEPEMVNRDSALYRAHPEWCLHLPRREAQESRHQLVLDMANPAVVNYLKESFTEVFRGIDIDYFKWDMNRNMTDVGTPSLPAERQDETAHRYMLGVYELFRFFRERFPNAMIENCSGGGGRYDLGMMKYSTMIWTSDNTNPMPRIKIQYSSLLAYPAATMSCHVSNPENVCEDENALRFRWQVAVGGALGYELHLPEASESIRNTITKQIEAYRKVEDLILRGDYFPLCNPFECGIIAYYYTNADKSRILLSALQNGAIKDDFYILSVSDIDKNAVYRDAYTGERYEGEELLCGIRYDTEDKENSGRVWYLIKE